jgi:hypothetical protein
VRPFDGVVGGVFPIDVVVLDGIEDNPVVDLVCGGTGMVDATVYGVRLLVTVGDCDSEDVSGSPDEVGLRDDGVND